MLGLHQTHMSYSPAAVAAAAASQRGGRDESAKLRASSKTGSKLGCAAGRKDNHEQHKQQYSTVMQQAVHPANMPLVIGTTAAPPKSRKSSSRTRAAPRAENASLDYYQQQQQQQQQVQIRHDGPEERHFLVQRQLETDNQVVLIMSDTGAHAGANGIPVIGRRLPSKSFSEHQQRFAAMHHEDAIRIKSHTQLAGGQTPTPIDKTARGAGKQVAATGAVLGRRSHRILQKSAQPRASQTEQLVQYQYGSRDYTNNQTQVSMQQQQQQQQQVRQQQPLSITSESISQASEHGIRVAQVLEYSQQQQRQLASGRRYPSLSMLDECEQVNCTARVASSTRATRKGAHGSRGARRAPKFSSSCLSLSANKQQKQVCTDLCCQPAAAALKHLEHLGGFSAADCTATASPLPIIEAQQPCLMPCCIANLTKRNLRRSSSGGPAKRATRRHETPVLVASDHLLTQVEYVARGGPSASRAQRSSSLSRNADGPSAALRIDHQRSSRLAAPPMNAGGAPLLMQVVGSHINHNLRHGGSSATPTASPSTSSSTSPYNQTRNHRRRLSATPPPVPSKPSNLSMLAGCTRQQLLLLHKQQLERQQDQESTDAAVTQMYESLAAELKAKLGNPNRAPILLPPKDYDTLSRQQGKLTGIELRRSTNPKLVGPRTTTTAAAATASAPCASKQMEAHARVVDTNTTATYEGQMTRTANDENDFDDNCRAAASLQKPSAAVAGAQLKHELVHLVAGQGNEEEEEVEGEEEEEEVEVGKSSLQRSRSNSSSGLGSISLSASSPDHNDSRGSPAHSAASLDSAEHAQQQQPTPMHSRSHRRPAGDKQQACQLARETTCSRSKPSFSSSSPNSLSSSCDARIASPEFIQGATTPSNHNYEEIHNNNNNNNNSNSNVREKLSANQGTSGSERKTTAQHIATSELDARRGKGIENHNPSKVSDGILWNGRVEIPLKVNSERRNGNTYLATKQIIY